jgi:hypothetical protein
MTPHERDLILKVADEVRAADRTAVDPDAERLIRTEVAAQRHAAYILTQRVIVQTLALEQARARMDELEARLRQVGAPTGSASDPAGGGGAPPAAGPSAGTRSGVGDFLKTAAAAAAGTIGAELIYDGLRHWAAGHGGIGSGSLGGLSGGSFLPTGTSRDDFGTDDTDTRERSGGGDFGSDSAADDDVEEAEDADEVDDADDSAGAGGDWGDVGSGGDDSAGAGGDW